MGKNKGITLIALAVTVTVLLILAGVTLAWSTGDEGIIFKSKQKKQEVQEANEREELYLAARDTITEGNGAISKEVLSKKIQSYLGNEGKLTGSGPWQYIGKKGTYNITTEGKVVEGWVCVYDESSENPEAPIAVTNGTLTIEIGAYINYNPGTTGTYTAPKGTYQEITYKVVDTKSTELVTYNCAEAQEYQKLLDKDQVVVGTGNIEDQTYSVKDADSIKWRVIGVDEETGEILIVASDVLKKEDGTAKNITLRGLTGYLYGVDEINKVCSIYGNGKGATGARSIEYDDIRKVVGKEKSENSNTYTYSWGPESLQNLSPYCSEIGKYIYFPHVKEGTTTGVFNYYNTATKRWLTNTKELKDFSGSEKIVSIKPDYVAFDVSGSDSAKYVGTKGYGVVFQTDAGSTVGTDSMYWVGTKYRYAKDRNALWGLYYVGSAGTMLAYDVYNSFGAVFSSNCGIRPVVSLDRDVEFGAVSSDSYNIK